MQALKAAQCEDNIAKLPEGIDTIIGTKGTYVSGGEMQRLSIARAMLKNAPILILDEATAFADPDNEAKVQKAFSTLSKDKTVIMIAHRLSSIDEALNNSCHNIDSEATREQMQKQIYKSVVHCTPYESIYDVMCGRRQFYDYRNEFITAVAKGLGMLPGSRTKRNTGCSSTTGT